MRNWHNGTAPNRRRDNNSPAALPGATGLAAAALCCIPLTVTAQEEARGGLEEIVVTAQRREQSIQDVPVSMSAIGQEQLDSQGVRSVDDLVELTPGVTFARTGFGSDLGSTISIRGISSGAGAATTGIYIDDTPVQTRATIASGNFSTNAYPRLFDVERVEVLRGPQGTLFGAGAEGGAVRFITPAPSLDTLKVYTRTEISSTEHGDLSYEAGGAVGVPLIQDKVGLRASVSYRRDGGFVDRYDFETGQMIDEDANSGETLSARLALGFAVTDQLTITPSVLYQKIDLDESSNYWVPLTDGNFTQPFGDVSKADYANGRRVPQVGKQELTLSALKIEYDFGGAKLTSNTSYYDREDNSITDYTNFEPAIWTGLPFPPRRGQTAVATDLVKNEFFTQEVRLQSGNPDARLKWVVGAFYSDEEILTSRWVENPWLGEVMSLVFPFCTPDTCVETIFGAPLAEGRYPFKGDTTTNDKQKAVFAQADFDFTDHLTGTVGLRYADYDFDFKNVVDGPINGPPLPRTDRGKNSESTTTPKVGLQYRTGAGDLFYASAAKGFRVGGANVPVNNLECQPGLEARGYDAAPLTYDSDSVWAYELGAKSELADGRLRLNSSVFYIEWSDIIQNVGLTPSCVLSFTDNLGSATSKGVDLEATFAPIDALTLTATVGYTDAYYTENFVVQTSTGPRTIVSDGDALNGSRWSGNLGAHLRFQAFGGRDLYVRANYAYQGKNDPFSYQNPNNVGYSPRDIFVEPATHMYDMRGGVNLGDWDVNLFIDNLTNEHPVLNQARAGGTAPLRTAYPVRPRTIGMQATMRF